MLAVFLAAFANVVGLGVIVPLLPYFALHYGADAVEAAMLFSVFSLAQFLTAPLWGRLSDRIGRKPVILISFAGSTLGYVWLAFADGLVMIYLARIFAGVMNGWLATSQAYVADVTDEEGRAKGMGILGAAFGLGFIIGPALGGYLAGKGVVNYQLPMLIAAAGSAIAFIISVILLREPERYKNSVPSVVSFLPRMRGIPILLVLIFLYFGLFFVFSGMESTFALWCDRMLEMGPRQVGYYLAFAGIVGVIVQGGLVGRLVPIFGETKVVIFGLICLAIGLAGLPSVSIEIWLLLPIGLLSVGFGFSNPSLQSLISRAAPNDMRGGTMGVAQSMNSLGRITGPAWAGIAFIHLGVSWPFYSGAALVIPILLASILLSRRVRYDV
ncbi:MAG: MFS transporter [Pseudomonadota bacterium]|nr:MFS transporter [Pseudomonadota bacterium]